MLVSASEWTDSASIDDDAVNKNATNLVTAMPRLANIAVTTALTLPSVATEDTLRGRAETAAMRPSVSKCDDALSLSSSLLAMIRPRRSNSPPLRSTP